MKSKLFLFFLLLQFSFCCAQNIQINQLSASSVAGGINVNLKVTSLNGASYSSYTYTLFGNTINLSVCYSFNPLAIVLQFNNDFLIPVPNNVNYVVNVAIINSSSPTVCNNFSNGPTATTNFLNVDNFDLFKQDYLLFPNPTNGKIAFKNTEKTFNQISFFDIQGRLVKQFKSNFKDGFDLFDLENGVYIVKVKTENGMLTQKIFLKK